MRARAAQPSKPSVLEALLLAAMRVMDMAGTGQTSRLGAGRSRITTTGLGPHPLRGSRRRPRNTAQSSWTHRSRTAAGADKPTLGASASRTLGHNAGDHGRRDDEDQPRRSLCTRQRAGRRPRGRPACRPLHTISRPRSKDAEIDKNHPKICLIDGACCAQWS